MGFNYKKLFEKAGIHPGKKEKPAYHITRFLILRLLGFVYLFAFLSLATQLIPLLGGNGLLPAENFINFYGTQFESKTDAFINHPTIFWYYISDNFMLILAWIGVLLSIIVMIGFANTPIMLLLWAFYFSFVNIGQTWFGYGWEMQLLETGLICAFLCPLWDARPFPKKSPPVPVIWMLRWLAFRIHIGAGLIKLRGDECWRKLTCLYYHYETQPIPNPLSPYLHFMPKWFHKLGLLWGHFIELIVPFFVFYPGILRNITGIFLISFQFILILSGNYSFLNWLTIVPILACFDDGFLRKIMPRWVIKKAEYAAMHSTSNKIQWAVVWVLFIITILLSFTVVKNLASDNQIMNTSFNRMKFVNTYGLFGSIGKERYELVFEGTSDSVLTSNTKWQPYEFKAKPTDVDGRLPIIAPYQPRLDWQLWFAAMQTPDYNPWLIHMIWKLLDNDDNALSLIESNPFTGKPPTYIRVSIYRYKFAELGSGHVWEREYLGIWLPPLSREMPEFRQYIQINGWRVV